MIDLLTAVALAIAAAVSPSCRADGPRISIGPQVVINGDVVIRGCGLLIESHSPGCVGRPVVIVAATGVRFKPGSTVVRNCRSEVVK